jgi:prepilin-type processing-associated H-X9-DG protein
MTSYVLVTGPGTAFPDGQTTKLADFRDGSADTILIVEVANSGIHWMEPRDLNIQQMATTINAKPGQGISSCHPSGAVVVFADGHVESLDTVTSAEQLRAMLTIDGGEVVKARD